MNPEHSLCRAFDWTIDRFHDSPGIRRLFDATLEPAHYGAYLRETYYYTRENPQLQALATVFFRGQQRAAVGGFLRHALSEIGHDELALSDLQALGVPDHRLQVIRESQPLPATTALLAFPFYQIYNQNVAGYLGYLYFLEFMPTRFGDRYTDALQRSGIPDSAQSFLRHHRTVDMGHTKLMTDYVQQIIQGQLDLEAAVYGMRVTGELFAGMVHAAFADADADPYGVGRYGTNSVERASAYRVPGPTLAVATSAASE